jgi:hypothetical protein
MVGRKAQRDRRNWAPLRRAGFITRSTARSSVAYAPWALAIAARKKTVALFTAVRLPSERTVLSRHLRLAMVAPREERATIVFRSRTQRLDRIASRWPALECRMGTAMGDHVRPPVLPLRNSSLTWRRLLVSGQIYGSVEKYETWSLRMVGPAEAASRRIGYVHWLGTDQIGATQTYVGKWAASPQECTAAQMPAACFDRRNPSRVADGLAIHVLRLVQVSERHVGDVVPRTRREARHARRRRESGAPRLPTRSRLSSADGR